MKLWVGLGNPGDKYAGNRHNIGFMAVDEIAALHLFGPWQRRFQGLACEGRLGGGKVILLKPQTFMNLSGQSVQAAMAFYKLSPADLCVFHDELDLTPGRIRFKQGGGHAGHNGLRSLHAHIGENYGRVRLGIGHPGHKDAVSSHVLHDFAKADHIWLPPLLRAIAQSADDLAKWDGARFCSRVALHLAPPKSAPPPAPKPQLVIEPEAPPQTTLLQKLIDRFK